MFEPEQHDFTRIVEAYATGVFRDSFHDTADLQVKVVQGLRELDSKPSPLEFKRLIRLPTVSWSTDTNRANSFINSQGALLELHVLAVDHPGYSAREMERLIESMVNRVRGTRCVNDDVALSLSRSKDHAVVSIENNRRPAWDKSQVWKLLDVRLYKTGQISIRATLPRDQMGSILDPTVLPQQIAAMLRLTGSLGIIQQGHVVVATGVSSDASVSIDTFDPIRSRSGAQPLSFDRLGGVLRTEPDESVSLAALGNGADEVAGDLSRALFGQLTT